jgi:DNA replication protein DnaC
MTGVDLCFNDVDESDFDPPAIAGWLPLDAKPEPELLARWHAEYDTGCAFGEKLERFLARRWHAERVRRNQTTLRQHKHRQHELARLRVMSPRHAEIVIAGRVDESAVAIVKLRAWDCKRNIAVLAGPPGTGKTLAALWWVAQPDGVQTEWIAATAYARLPRFAREDADNERERVLEASALVLDDLGAEHGGESVRVDVDELVDAYYRDNRTLLITTNLDAKQFERRYGLRVSDRLAECGKWITVDGVSRRRSKGQPK